MQIYVHLRPCKSVCFSSSYSLRDERITVSYRVQEKAFLGITKRLAPENSHFDSSSNAGWGKASEKSKNFPFGRKNLFISCSRNNVSDDFSSTQLPEKSREERIQESEEIGLLNKPLPVPTANEFVSEANEESRKPDKDEALAPFLKFFKTEDSEKEEKEERKIGDSSEKNGVTKVEKGNRKKVNVEYYEPKPGDMVVGVVVSGDENKLDVNVGADFLGTMLTKDVLPLYDKEIEYLLCDMNKNSEDFMVNGKIGVVKNDDAINGRPGQGQPVVEIGTILFAEVLGRTLSGRPLLSTRRLFRKTAWHRVRQLKQLNEPLEVRITEWNTGGLLTRIEGLRAFLPKAELSNRANNFTELKENVGRWMHVKIARIDEAKNDLILSEKEAWESLYFREGALLEGTVQKIFPFGAQIRIWKTNRSGLLHISNITRGRVTSVEDLLAVDEKVKVLVVKSLFPDKIALSIADLESEPGLFISDRKRVFDEAGAMAKKYRQKLTPFVSVYRSESPSPDDALPYENESTMYANWSWFKFETES